MKTSKIQKGERQVGDRIRKEKVGRVWGAFWNVQRPTLTDMVGLIGEPRF